jgi:hypothetical protein
MDSDRFKFIIVPLRKSGDENELCSRLFFFSANGNDKRIPPEIDAGDTRRKVLVEE